jgi:hypothetical protein
MRPSPHCRPTTTRCLPISCLFVICVPLLALGQQTASPDANTDKATIQALLVEVRQLRLAIERSTSLVPRIQVAAQRLQLQQDRVDRLSKELRDFRTKMANTPTKEQLAGAIKQLEGQIADTQDTARRKELEAISKNMTANMEQMTAREQQDRGQEIDLMSQLQAEQAKLNELTDQLSALDKRLDQQ